MKSVLQVYHLSGGSLRNVIPLTSSMMCLANCSEDCAGQIKKASDWILVQATFIYCICIFTINLLTKIDFSHLEFLPLKETYKWIHWAIHAGFHPISFAWGKFACSFCWEKNLSQAKVIGWKPAGMTGRTQLFVSYTQEKKQKTPYWLIER